MPRIIRYRLPPPVPHCLFQRRLSFGPHAGVDLFFFAFFLLTIPSAADQDAAKSVRILYGERLELPTVGAVQLWEEHRMLALGVILLGVIAAGLILLLLRGLARLRRMRRELNDRLRFERLIAMLSTKLVNVPPEKVDQEVEKGLDEVVETMKLDRCALFELANDTGDLRITNKKVGADAVPFPLCKQQLPWLFEQTSLGKVVILPDVAQGLPAEANAEKEFFRNFGINSALAFPFVQAGGTALAILYASASRQRKWPDEIVHDLHSIGQIFASALARKKADESRQESEATISLAAQSASLGLWSRDMPTDKIWATERTRTLYDFSAEAEVTFGQFLESLHPDDRPATEKSIAGAVADHCDYNIVHRVIRADGTARWIAARGRAIYSATGQPLKMMGASFDITERRQRALETEGHRQELAHLGRVALMGEMAASLAHELNQPLTAIVTNAAAGQRFLDRGVIDPRELHELLLDIALDGERAGKIIRGIREMVRKGNTNREPVDMNRVVKDVVRLTNSDAVRNGCVLVTELDSQLPRVEADAVQLQQVLLNLILNAFDAMERTPLHLRRVVLSTISLGRTSEATGAVRTTVRDFGTGFSEKVRQRIFEHFFSTKRDGLGMGLAIARSIVESFGGVLDAANAIDGGAIFHFTLPALY